MLWFLIGTAVLFAAIGDVAEALTLAVAVIPLLGMDAYLHRRTRASTAGLASRLASAAHVLRDGQWGTIPARELVPGDLVEVATGDYFPADGLLVAGDARQCDESTLTGEAMPDGADWGVALLAGSALAGLIARALLFWLRRGR